MKRDIIWMADYEKQEKKALCPILCKALRLLYKLIAQLNNVEYGWNAEFMFSSLFTICHPSFLHDVPSFSSFKFTLVYIECKVTPSPNEAV